MKPFKSPDDNYEEVEIERDIYITMLCDPKEYGIVDDLKSRKSGKTSHKLGSIEGFSNSPQKFRHKAKKRMISSKRFMTPQVM